VPAWPASKPSKPSAASGSPWPGRPGWRPVEHLRLVLAEVKIACVRTQVALTLFTDFDITDMTQPGTLTPAEHQEPTLTRMLDEIATWSQALAPLRPPASDLTPAQ
jgi:hypothetical protein